MAIFRLLKAGGGSTLLGGDTLLGGTTVNAGVATETDSALAVTILKVYAAGLATETDSVLPATVKQGITVVVGLATETDTAFRTFRDTGQTLIPPLFANVDFPNTTLAPLDDKGRSQADIDEAGEGTTKLADGGHVLVRRG